MGRLVCKGLLQRRREKKRNEYMLSLVENDTSHIQPGERVVFCEEARGFNPSINSNKLIAVLTY
jgi:hypothetical protein